MDVKEFENRRWKGEDQAVQFRHRSALALIRSEEGPVLDLGSGDGLLLSLFKERGISGKGLDLAEEGVRKTREKGLEAEVYDFGSKKLPFKDGEFGAATLLDILEHLYDPGSVLKEAARVARGPVVVGVPNFGSFPARLQVLFGKVPENNLPKKGHVYWFTLSELLRIAKNAGLSLSELRVNTVFERVPVAGFIFKMLARMRPSLFGLSFVARFEK
ncbi:MAG TPA: methionine biosynthesis protein MetW [Candidatus Paceibacterota bacterium]|nr:methionine biosynthesis protein MetW [Candidatus Paceibacterota bacterium]